jgi:hypothetical protein
VTTPVAALLAAQPPRDDGELYRQLLETVEEITDAVEPFF